MQVITFEQNQFPTSIKYFKNKNANDHLIYVGTSFNTQNLSRNNFYPVKGCLYVFKFDVELQEVYQMSTNGAITAIEISHHPRFMEQCPYLVLGINAVMNVYELYKHEKLLIYNYDITKLVTDADSQIVIYKIKS